MPPFRAARVTVANPLAWREVVRPTLSGTMVEEIELVNNAAGLVYYWRHFVLTNGVDVWMVDMPWGEMRFYAWS